MSFSRLCEFLGHSGLKFEKYSRFSPVPLNLKAFLNFGETAPASKSFEFLKQELPVRIANTMGEIAHLPSMLLGINPVKDIIALYDQTFDTLIKYEQCQDVCPSILSEFTEDIQDILMRHSGVVESMAVGIQTLKLLHNFSTKEEVKLQYFLDRFYINRVALRMLMHQHLSLYGPILHEAHGCIGIIDPSCSPLKIAVGAYVQAHRICKEVYNRAPGCDIEIYDRLSNASFNNRNKIDLTVDAKGEVSQKFTLFKLPSDCVNLQIKGEDFTFCYVPKHLHYILFELLKNAMRAVVENHDQASLPRIHILICQAAEDVSIKVTDPGLGMAFDIAQQVFNYAYSTAKSNSNNPDFKTNPTEPNQFSPMAGRGHGLPLSRLYARYLSGELCLHSVQSVGTSAIIRLKRLPEKANELLPIYNQTSRNMYEIRELTSDWTKKRYQRIYS